MWFRYLVSNFIVLPFFFSFALPVRYRVSLFTFLFPLLLLQPSSAHPCPLLPSTLPLPLLSAYTLSLDTLTSHTRTLHTHSLDTPVPLPPSLFCPSSLSPLTLSALFRACLFFRTFQSMTAYLSHLISSSHPPPSPQLHPIPSPSPSLPQPQASPPSPASPLYLSLPQFSTRRRYRHVLRLLPAKWRWSVQARRLVDTGGDLLLGELRRRRRVGAGLCERGGTGRSIWSVLFERCHGGEGGGGRKQSVRSSQQTEAWETSEKTNQVPLSRSPSLIASLLADLVRWRVRSEGR